jgi:hypothetical protein
MANIRPKDTPAITALAAGDKVIVDGAAGVRSILAGDFVGQAGGWSNTRLAKTAAYPVVNADKGKTIALGGAAFYTLTINAASGYDANFSIVIDNEDTARAKTIAINGLANFFLYPGQCILVFNQNNVWQVLGRSRWKAPAGALSVFTDFTNGNDANDGLAAGAGNAKKTVQGALGDVLNDFDFNGTPTGQSQVSIQMAAQTTDTTGVHYSPHDTVGGNGGAAITIQGATLAVTGAANNGGGLVRLAMASTASYATGNSVAVRNVNGTVEANGVWKITVIDATHIDLQGSAFANAYVSGGTVSNGSVISATGVDAIATYFGSVLQIQDITLQSNQNNLNLLWGSKAYLAGVIFGGTPAGAHISLNGFAQAEFAGPVGISGNAAYFCIGNVGNLRTVGQKLSITNNLTFSGQFVLATASGTHINFQATTIALQGNTVTGQRFNVGNGATLSTGLVDGNLSYFPGNSAGVIVSGGQYDSVLAPPSLTSLTGSVGADITMTPAATYFDGPSVAQGTVGTWLVTGTVSISGATVNDNIVAKLWDGATLISDLSQQSNGNSGLLAISLSGVITNPTGNLRITVMDVTTAGAKIKAGDGIDATKASTITAIRIG